MAEARVAYGVYPTGGQTLPIRVDADGRVILSTGGSFYPEVTNFASLPPAGTHSGEIYVVLNGSGVYVVNRKSAGLYISDGVNWSRLGNVPAYFSDVNFKVYNDADNTKKIDFSLSGITTGTTRTATWQDKDETVAYLSDTSALTTVGINNGDSPYNATISEVILGDCTAGDITINLPPVSTSTDIEYYIKKTAGVVANTITVDGNGAETIDGATTQEVKFTNDAIHIICDGTEWWIL